MWREHARPDAGRMNVIEVDTIVKRYGDRAAVDGVSFAVEEGEIFAILGPNGAGKTTTVESIAGLRTPDSGTIPVLGLDPRRRPSRAAPAGRRPAPGEPAARPAARLGGARAVRLVLRDARRLASGSSTTSAWPTQRKTAFGKLSGGQKQRLSIALALVGNPRIAILDELTTGLDPQARRDTWDLIEGDPRPRRHGHPGHPLHGGGRAARRPDRRDRRRAGRRTRHPGGHRRRVDAEQRMRFRPSAPFDESILTGLPEVRTVTHVGPTVVVTGTGNLVHAVTSVLARNQIVANDLRIEQADLDDAFIALTGRRLAS